MRIPFILGCRYGDTTDNETKCDCTSGWGHRANPPIVSPPSSDEIEGIRPALPTDPADRKQIPLCTGVLDYFPKALCEVAKVSRAGNLQHNGPDAPLHWARGKSNDQADTIMRHLAERGSIDVDGQRHSAKLAWRSLALLELELEAEGAPMSRGSK